MGSLRPAAALELGHDIAVSIASKMERNMMYLSGLEKMGMVGVYVKGRPVPRRIMCPKCGAMIDLSGGSVSSLTPKPTSLDEVRGLFSAGERQMLEIEETSMAYMIKPKIYLGRKARAA